MAIRFSPGFHVWMGFQLFHCFWSTHGKIRRFSKRSYPSIRWWWMERLKSHALDGEILDTFPAPSQPSVCQCNWRQQISVVQTLSLRINFKLSIKSKEKKGGREEERTISKIVIYHLLLISVNFVNILPLHAKFYKFRVKLYIRQT